MNTFTVTVTQQGFVQAVHHSIRADNATAACDVARMFHPPRAGYEFTAELID